MNWWNWLPAWAQRLLARIPSPAIEFVGGFIAVACGYVAMRLLALLGPIPTKTLGAFVITIGASHFMTVLYEIWLDPRRNDPTHHEVRDLLEREIGIIVALFAAYWLLF